MTLQPLHVKDTPFDRQRWLDHFNTRPRCSKSRILLALLDEYPEFQATLEQEIPDPAERARFVKSLQNEAREGME